ncbi:MAG: ABC transporter permease [Bryobacteraceae bacterium]
MLWRRRTDRDQDLERELRSHLELEAAEQRENGLAEDEARYAAYRAFGNRTRIKEELREMWLGMSMEGLWQDLRFAVRAMVKNAGVSAIAVVMLALGAGANTTIFSLINTVLLRPLPYRDADRLVMVWGYNRPRGFNTDQVSLLDFSDWRSQNHVFEEMAASTDAMYTLTGSGDPAPIIGYQFSANYFHVLGVTPLMGRTFLPEEEQAGKNHVVLLSYRLWQRHFGGDRNLVGRAVKLDGEPYTVIGIMPPGVEYPTSTELWTPLTIPREAVNDRAYRFLRIIARLKHGVSAQQAQMEMNAIAARLAREHPSTNKEEDATNIIGLRRMISGDIQPALLVLLCAVGFVLLIACANVANLLLVQAFRRHKEVAIRTALGAGSSRLVRQFLTESVLLALAGSALGLLLALISTRTMVALFPPTIANLQIPRVEHVPIDGWVLAFALGISLMTGVIFGLFPALQSARVDTNESLKESARAVAGGGVRGLRFRNLLVMAEVALSVALLAAAALTLKSFAHSLRGDLGFKPQNVLTLRLLLPQSRYPTEAKQLALSNQILERLKSLPGIESAGTVTFLPLSGWWGTRGVSMISQSASQSPVWSSVTPGYFSTLTIPLAAGRLFTGHDSGGGAPVAIISKTLSRQLAPNGDAVGKRIKVEGLKSPVEVVGVVGDVHQLGMTSEITSEIYLPFAQVPEPLICVAMRTAGDPASLIRAAQREVWAVDKDQAVSFAMSMEQLTSESLAPQRATTVLLGVFAGMALLMAVVGIYGVVSFSAAQRTHEIGVRLALGAQSGDVARLVLGKGLVPVIVGLALGLAGSFGLMRSLSSILYGVSPSDPVIFAIVPIVLIGAALIATYIPARRVMRVDPMEALRYE